MMRRCSILPLPLKALILASRYMHPKTQRLLAGLREMTGGNEWIRNESEYAKAQTTNSPDEDGPGDAVVIAAEYPFYRYYRAAFRSFRAEEVLPENSAAGT